MRAIKNDTGLLSAAEQTRLTWARVVVNREQIPPAFQEAFSSQFPQSHAFPYTLLTPSFAGFLRPVREKLVCCTEQALTIFEKLPGRIGLTVYDFNDINYVESGKVLLLSWLIIRGIDQQGRFCTSTLRFNTISEKLFLPLLSHMRPIPDTSSGSELKTEQAKFHYLSTINYKFMNYGRRSIRPGDSVLRIICQPEKRAVILRFLGKSISRLVFPAHLLILTDRELIDIRDASRIASYGGIWNYIPLERIKSVRLDEENGLLNLRLELPHNDRLEIPFVTSLRSGLDVLLEEIRAAISV